MENISKTEFEEMGLKYPLAYQHFHNWIDSYKDSIEWNQLFGGNALCHEYGIKEEKPDDFSPKFHSIPFEMQFGILAKFMIEILQDEHLLLQLDKDIFKRLLRKVFHILNKRLETLEQRQEQELKTNN